MKPFELGIDVVMMRFFLMMAVVITGVLTYQWWLTFLALPIFLSMILGVRFSLKKEKKATAKIITMNANKKKQRKAS